MNEELIRKAFEDCITEGGRWPKAVERMPDGTYKLIQTHAAWRNYQHGWQAATRAAVPAGLSFGDALCLARGCTDYRGGHHGDAYEAFQHGIQTVVNVLTAAQKKGLSEYQIAVVHAIGSEVQP